MQCRMVELRWKEVINICDGSRLGFVGDVEVLLPEGRVAALVVPGPCRFFGLFGRGEEYYIPWECIKQIGDDIILIDKPVQRRPPYQSKRRKKGSFF
ncbi:MAG: YlmC/YmxH family sporulation protein [Oscillospiraceae bacterium]|nr:YlmC/YmxH family sporulation protein [Oscillospiraceae bacterium]